MRNFFSVVELAVLVWASCSDGAPTQRRAPHNHIIRYHRDHAPPQQQVPAPVNHQPAPVSYQPAPVPYQIAPVSYQPAPVPYQPAPVSYQPAPVPYQPAPVSYQPALIRGQDPRHNSQRGGGVVSSSVAPSYHTPLYGPGPSAHPQDGAPSTPQAGDAFPAQPGQTAGNDLETPNPTSRCVLCAFGGCPDCHRLDSSGVCRPVFGCSPWDNQLSVLGGILRMYPLLGGSDGDGDDGAGNVDLRRPRLGGSDGDGDDGPGYVDLRQPRPTANNIQGS